MLIMKSTTSPTLSSGAFTQAFGEAQAVVNAVATISAPGAASGSIGLACNTAVSGNGVVVTVNKLDTSGGTGPFAYANASTGDVSGMTVTVIADCE